MKFALLADPDQKGRFNRYELVIFEQPDLYAAANYAMEEAHNRWISGEEEDFNPADWSIYLALPDVLRDINTNEDLTSCGAVIFYGPEQQEFGLWRVE